MERYGDCPRCRGKGKITINQVEIKGEDGETVTPEKVEQTKVEQECPRCGGTGFSGDAMDRRG